MTDILFLAKQYQKSYRDIKMRQRVERVEEIGKYVVSACIEKEKVRKDGLEYIRSDNDLRTDVQMFLGELRLRLEKELKCNFKLNDSDVTPSPDEIEEENQEVTSGVEECGFFKRSEYDGDDDMFSVAVRMLGKLTMGGYNELRGEIIQKFKIPKQWIPSFGKLTANRPKVFGYNIIPSLITAVTNPPPEKTGDKTKPQFVKDLEDVGLFVEEGDINDNILSGKQLIPKVTEQLIPKVTAYLGLTSFVG